ncbi:MAG: transporter substrate-binding domain-containing protein [Methanoregula sp.]|jgi:ABC-type amino acid transport substrate-binding protein
MKTGCLCLAVLILVALLAACGCTAPVSSGNGNTAGTPAVTATDAGIRIITEEQYPFNYAGPNGTVTGQATDVVRGILSRLNQTANITILPWSEGYSLARAGPGVALYSTVRTDDREHLFKWVGPVSSYDYIIYARNDSMFKINSLESVKKAGRICVVKDDFRHQFLLENNFTNITTTGSDNECIRQLLAGSADLWLGSSVNARETARNEGIDPSSFHEVFPVRTVQTYIAFSPDTPDSVIGAWQGALDTMKSDGTFAEIERQYGMAGTVSAAVPASADAVADQAVNAMVATTDGQMKAILRPYEVLALTDEARSGEWNRIQPLLAALMNKEPDTWLWYARPDGSYYAVAEGLTSANLRSRSYFPTVLAGKESVGTVVVSHNTGRNAGIVAVPVVKDGTVTGVLGASVYLDTLTDSLRADIPEPFVFYAIDSEGKFALHSDKGQISRDITTIGPDTSFGKAITGIRTGYSGRVEYEDGGVRYIANFRTAPLTSWKCVVAWPEGNSTIGA